MIALLEQSDAALPRSALPGGVTLIHDHCRAEESRGVGWARARLQGHFDGEGFYLQLDGHHRFSPGWDSTLCAELSRCPSPHPILSGYLPPLLDDQTPDPCGGTLHASHFDEEGVLHIKSHPTNGDLDGPPVRGSYLSGHFIFSTGEFVGKVPYDPDFYFFGEEVSLSARAFTHGFDVFHPRRTVAWHRYGRMTERRHWNDHSSWGDIQRKSLEKWRRIFADEPLVAEADGLGKR